ncbi:unnamed protein product [Nippostrongylus brasiliensis]|uniref:Malectin domain-containing protein n=1 Tax=Nippostrongylus brasiliensis TaxID=27835 RepID=A0A158R270_NIPBR|nr:unnamed protein product [Nippostrongylus brasiliensis]
MSPFSYALLTLVAGFSSVSGKPPDLSDRVVHAVNCEYYSRERIERLAQPHSERQLSHIDAKRALLGNSSAIWVPYLEDSNTWALTASFTRKTGIQSTERYHNGELAYVFDIAKDGDYVIVLKFSEIFHVHVNDIAVKKNLDIYRETRAPGFAYDMYIDVSIRKKEIVIGEMIGDIDKELQIRLVPRRRSREEMLESSDDDVEDEPYDHEPIVSSGHELASGPPAHNPFEDKNDNVFVYLGVTLVCLLPVVAFIMHM